MAKVHITTWIDEKAGAFGLMGWDDKGKTFNLIFESSESLKDFVVQLREQLTNDGTLGEQNGL